MSSANSGVVDEKLSMSVQTCERNCMGPKNPSRGKFQASIGAHEIFNPETWRAALTELVASASLMFTLSTTIIACLDSHEVDPKLSVPFAVFIIVFLFLIVTVPLSGGHISPVFTLIATLKGVTTLSRALLYLLAQCIGSIIGFFILKCVMDPRLVNTYSLGGCAIGGKGLDSSINQYEALLLEFSCTFLVLFLGVTLAFDKKRSKNLGFPMVCLVIAGAMALAVFMSITVTGRAGYGGVGLNPARCLGAALVHGGSLWNGLWVFWVGPILACLIYYSVSINLPKEGLVLVDGEYDVLKLALGSSGIIPNGDISKESFYSASHVSQNT